MARKPLPLPLYCATCHGAVTLEFAPDGSYRVQRWTCPRCGVINALNMAGRIVTVTVREGTVH